MISNNHIFKIHFFKVCWPLVSLGTLGEPPTNAKWPHDTAIPVLWNQNKTLSEHSCRFATPFFASLDLGQYHRVGQTAELDLVSWEGTSAVCLCCQLGNRLCQLGFPKSGMKEQRQDFVRQHLVSELQKSRGEASRHGCVCCWVRVTSLNPVSKQKTK